MTRLVCNQVSIATSSSASESQDSVVPHIAVPSREHTGSATSADGKVDQQDEGPASPKIFHQCTIRSLLPSDFQKEVEEPEEEVEEPEEPEEPNMSERLREAELATSQVISALRNDVASMTWAISSCVARAESAQRSAMVELKEACNRMQLQMEAKLENLEHSLHTDSSRVSREDTESACSSEDIGQILATCDAKLEKLAAPDELGGELTTQLVNELRRLRLPRPPTTSSGALCAAMRAMRQELETVHESLQDVAKTPGSRCSGLSIPYEAEVQSAECSGPLAELRLGTPRARSSGSGSLVSSDGPLLQLTFLPNLPIAPRAAEDAEENLDGLQTARSSWMPMTPVSDDFSPMSPNALGAVGGQRRAASDGSSPTVSSWRRRMRWGNELFPVGTVVQDVEGSEDLSPLSFLKRCEGTCAPGSWEELTTEGAQRGDRRLSVVTV